MIKRHAEPLLTGRLLCYARNIVIVNGHGGNTPAQSVCGEFLRDHANVRIKWHDWWNAPQVWPR